MMNENGEISAEAAQSIANSAAAADEGIDVNAPRESQRVADQRDPVTDPFMNGEIRTLDGDLAGDEFAADAINYQVLLGKIDTLLEKLKLDA